MKTIPWICLWSAYFLFCAVISLPKASAGGPNITISGLPVLWDTSQPIVYHIDPGDLGTISNQEANQLIHESFAAWENAGFTSIRFEFGGLLEEDVTRQNFRQYITGSSGKNVVIYDDDGSIIDSLGGVGAKDSTLGFAAASTSGFGSTEFAFAYIILNGYFIENFNPDRGAAKSTILHELGHFIGIDHTQIHRHLAYDGVAANDTLVPIMFPTSADDDSSRTFLTNDDKAIANFLYPDRFFKARTGSITGVVKRGNKELPGINVIARKINEPSMAEHYYSTVTGYFEEPFGTFEIHGLPPGEYQVYIEPIDTFFTGASAVSKYTLNGLAFLDPPPSAFYWDFGTPPSRSTASVVTVRENSTASGLLIRARQDTSPSEEHDTQILALNTMDIGAVPPFGISEFQYLFEPSSDKESIVIAVQSDDPRRSLELLVSPEDLVSPDTQTTAISRRGRAEIVLGEDGDLPLIKQRYFIAILNRSADDVSFRILATDDLNSDTFAPTNTPTSTATATSTPTSTPSPSPTNRRIPTRPPTETPVLRPSPIMPETPSSTPAIEQPTQRRSTATPTVTSTPTQPTPTATPTAREVAPHLGLVAIDEIGAVYPRGKAVDNFDIGRSFNSGFILRGRFDGIPDLTTMPELLFINGEPFSIAKDMEFSGEVDPNGNGSEGVYYLNAGILSNIPPVTAKLGATGGVNRGGIDTDNVPANNIDFGGFTSDPIPPTLSELSSNADVSSFNPLVDIEPAGNNGFYVLAQNGRIHAEGSANERIDRRSRRINLSPASIAVDMVIYRGTEISMTNSLRSDDLIGSGAYVLQQNGLIHSVGSVPPLNVGDAPILLNGQSFTYQDMELIPDPSGQEWIGLGLLNGNGLIHFIPFATTVVTPELNEYIRDLNPFGSLRQVFDRNIARGFEVEISDDPVFGLDRFGRTVSSVSRRVGILMFDVFGGMHTGGNSTRFTADFDNPEGDRRFINGEWASVQPLLFVGIDAVQDLEIAPPIDTSIRNPSN